jgi:thiamine-phosphate pyrophosphorylase
VGRFVPHPLYVICDAELCERSGWSVPDFVSACLDGGARLFQLRAKRASGSQLLDLADRLVALTAPVAGQVIVNDRADIARMASAAGVHVGQEDLTPAGVRHVAGAAAVVGLSTHTADQVTRGLTPEVSYLAIGPVFETVTKATGYTAVGLDGVRMATALTHGRHVPVVAIGGITLERAPSVLNAGARSVAVISDLLATGDPVRRVREYLDRLVETGKV